MGKKFKVGVIGCGTIGTVHLNAYKSVENAEVVALCDVLPDRLAEKAKEFNVGKTFTDYRELLADPEIEAVDICTPNDMHAPIAIDAFGAGKNVFLEKPMTLSAEWGRKILEARDKSGKMLQMGMVRRQTPEAEVVRDEIAAGRLGEIYQMRVKLIRRRGIPGLGGWFTTKARSGGGGLIDIAVHMLDLVMYVTDLWNPTRASAKVYSKFGSPIKDYHYVSMWAGPPQMDGTFDVDDYAAGFVRFGKQATMSFEVAWACNADSEESVEILGTKGGVKLGANTGVTYFRTEVGDRMADVAIHYDNNRDLFASQLTKFYKALAGEGEVAATGEQGLVAMRLLDAIYKSSDLDQEVEV